MVQSQETHERSLRIGGMHLNTLPIFDRYPPRKVLKKFKCLNNKTVK